jgi:quinolinate synthase
MAEGELPADKTFILSTGGMVRHARACSAQADFIGTEVGLIHRLEKENPDRSFVPVREDAICEYMKTITIPKLYRALRDLVYEIKVEKGIAERARSAIQRMVEIT